MLELKRYLRVYRTCLRIGLIREMEFRLNFFVWGLAMLVEYLIIWLFFYTIYENVNAIAGWSKYEWYFYLGYVQVLLTLFMTFLFPNLVALPWKINSGDLDFYLLKPINIQFLVSLNSMNFGYVVNFIPGFILMSYGFRNKMITMSITQIVGIIIFSIIGILILYSIFLLTVTISIWTKRANFASDLFFQLWSFLRNPAFVYSKIFRIFFSYVLPILLVGTVPVRIFLGRSDNFMMVSAVVLGGSWFIGSSFFWRKAIQSYTSASS